MFMDRYLLLQQRIRRNRLFTAPAFGTATAQQQRHIEVRAAASSGHSLCSISLSVSAVQLSSIKALVGNPGQTTFILGSITQPEDGRYYLEDPTASIPIDLSNAVTTTGFYTGARPSADLQLGFAQHDASTAAGLRWAGRR